jgi:hypothetical protein
LRKYSIELHVLICLEVEVLNRTLSTSSTERQIITWGSNEYFLNWETNYHMRFYWVLQLPDKLSHEVLLSTSSTERQIITWGPIEYSSTERQIITSWGSIEYFVNIEPHDVIICLWVEVLNRTSCDNLSLHWGSTQ